MAKISDQLDELAREARRIGVDIGPIISFSLDYMSTSEISELLYSLRDEFNTLAKKADSINNQIHEEKDKNKIRGNVKGEN